MALVCAPRNALSGHMTALYAQTRMHAHVRAHAHTVGEEKGLHAREIDQKTKNLMYYSMMGRVKILKIKQFMKHKNE